MWHVLQPFDREEPQSNFPVCVFMKSIAPYLCMEETGRHIASECGRRRKEALIIKSDLGEAICPLESQLQGQQIEGVGQCLAAG